MTMRFLPSLKTWVSSQFSYERKQEDDSGGKSRVNEPQKPTGFSLGLLTSAPLRKALKDWFWREDRPYPEITDFNKWLDEELGFLATMIDDATKVTIDTLVAALYVEAVGDVHAVKFAKDAAKKGWQTHTDCYVESGVVHANVWLAGKPVKQTEKMADAIAAKFRKMGYVAEVCENEDDANELMVDAAIEFPDYVKVAK